MCEPCTDAAENDEQLPGPYGLKYDDSEEHLQVTMAIQGVKKPPWFGWFGDGNTSVTVNAKEDSLRVYVERREKYLKVTKKTRTPGRKDKVDKCVWVVRKLPEKILPDEHYYKVRDNKVILTLKKAVPGSWQRTLDQYGIDVADV